MNWQCARRSCDRIMSSAKDPPSVAACTAFSIVFAQIGGDLLNSNTCLEYNTAS
jgi:hypothetical protein